MITTVFGRVQKNVAPGRSLLNTIDLLHAGAVGMVWAVMWFFLVYNSPATHPRISIEEREYIEKSLNTKAGGKVRKFCTII